MVAEPTIPCQREREGGEISRTKEKRNAPLMVSFRAESLPIKKKRKDPGTC